MEPYSAATTCFPPHVFIHTLEPRKIQHCATTSCTNPHQCTYAYGIERPHQGRYITEARPGTAPPRGALLPPLYGISNSVVSIQQLEDAATEAFPNGPTPSLILDQPYHAKLRSRIALNRSALHAVRNARHKDPFAPRYCPYCATFPYTKETAYHTLVECPRYDTIRNQLKLQLQDTINALRQRARRHDRWRTLIQNDSQALYYLILATPFALDTCIPNHRLSKKQLLILTGKFLEEIRRIRPF
jgi:hypothetical protein